MKTMLKNIIPFILITILASCNSFAPKPTETPIPTVTSLPTSTSTPEPTDIPFFEIPTPVIPTPIPTPYFSFVVDRNNPESVIRAYFDAMAREDGVAMESVMGTVTGERVPYSFGPNSSTPPITPIKSIKILEIKLISQSVGVLYHYKVRFSEQVDRDGKEYKDQPEWDFELVWADERQSFVIFNHGMG
jgi:hypothetical protein